MPGDIIVGDQDGIVVIPQKYAKDLLISVHENIKSEQKDMTEMKKGIFSEIDHKKMFLEKFLKNGGELV